MINYRKKSLFILLFETFRINRFRLNILDLIGAR